MTEVIQFSVHIFPIINCEVSVSNVKIKLLDFHGSFLLRCFWSTDLVVRGLKKTVIRDNTYYLMLPITLKLNFVIKCEIVFVLIAILIIYCTVVYGELKKYWKLEILKSLGRFYDGLALSPTGLNRFHIS